jgi:hypothetical protein
MSRRIEVIGFVALGALSILATSTTITSRETGAAQRADGPPAMGQPGTGTPAVTPTFDTSGPLPDLAIRGVGVTLDPAQHCPYPPATLGTIVIVRNIGDAPARSFVVDALGTMHRIMGLAAGEERSMWFDHYRDGSAGETDVVVDVGNLVREHREDNNEFHRRVPVPTLPACYPTWTPTPATGTPPPLPDLASGVTYAWVCACLPCPEQEPYGTVCIRNSGAGSTQYIVRSDILFLHVHEQLETAPIEPGAEVCQRIDSVAVEVVADSGDFIAESNENNNRSVGRPPTYTPPPPCRITPTATSTPPTERPDLVIEYLEPHYTDSTRTCDVPFHPVTSVKVANRGVAAAGHFVVRTEPDGALFGELAGLAPGTGSWLPPRPGWPDAVVIDADNEVAESDETNNRAVMTPPPPPTWAPTCSPTPTASRTATPTATPRRAFVPRAER